MEGPLLILLGAVLLIVVSRSASPSSICSLLFSLTASFAKGSQSSSLPLAVTLIVVWGGFSHRQNRVIAEKLIGRACFLKFYCGDGGIKYYLGGQHEWVWHDVCHPPCLMAQHGEPEVELVVIIWVEIPPKLCGLDEVQFGGDGGIQAKLLGERTGCHGSIFCIAHDKIATKICSLQQWKLNFQTSKTCRNFSGIFLMDIYSSTDVKMSQKPRWSCSNLVQKSIAN